jgi:hypothetical protein
MPGRIGRPGLEVEGAEAGLCEKLVSGDALGEYATHERASK